MEGCSRVNIREWIWGGGQSAISSHGISPISPHTVDLKSLKET